MHSSHHLLSLPAQQQQAMPLVVQLSNQALGKHLRRVHALQEDLEALGLLLAALPQLNLLHSQALACGICADDARAGIKSAACNLIALFVYCIMVTHCIAGKRVSTPIVCLMNTIWHSMWTLTFLFGSDHIEHKGLCKTAGQWERGNH